MKTKAQPGRPEGTPLGLLIGSIVAGTFAIALSGLPNLADNEGRMAAYVLDAVQQGRWICQHDAAGDLASKPPMYTWMAALATLPFGRLNRFSLYLPSSLATLLVSLIIFRAGHERFGWPSGFLAGMTYVLSAVADKQVTSARYDGLFTLPITLAALAAFRAWMLGRGWTWFWLAAAAATLVKGPLGVLLGASGLLAAWWEKRSGTPWRIRGPHWAGVGCFLFICGGWFWLAYRQTGPMLLDKMLGRELVGHAIGGNTSHFPLEGFYEPTRSFLSVFAPWSLLAVFGFWRVWRKPSEDLETRRFERFLFCWFFGGLLIFSLAAHQRGRLILPLIPAAALLAGRELGHYLSRWPPEWIRRAAMAGAAIFLLILAGYHQGLLGRSRNVRETVGMRELAHAVRQRLGDQFPLNHVDSPFALQFYLNRACPQLSPKEAGQILAGNYPAVVAISDSAELTSQLPAQVALYEIARWPTTNQAAVRVLSNVPRPEKTNRVAAVIGPLLIQIEDARLVGTKGPELDFASLAPTAQVTVSNRSARPEMVSVRFRPPCGSAVQRRLLEPGQSWDCQAGSR